MQPKNIIRLSINVVLAATLIIACEKQNYLGAPQSTNKKTTDGLIVEPIGGTILTAWFQQAGIPGPLYNTGRYGSWSFSIDGKGYLGGGIVRNGLTKRLSAVNDFYCYDTATRAWSQKASMPGTIRTGAASFVIGNLGYVVTGATNALGSAVNENWQYSTTKNVWVQKKTMPGTPRCYAVGASMNKMGYVGTGADNPDGDNAVFHDWWQYDPGTDSWTQKQNLPFSGGVYAMTSFTSPASAGSKIFVGSGRSPIDNDHSEFYQYDPVADSWTTIAPMPNARSYAVGMSIPQGGIVATGYNNQHGTSLNDIWEYNFTSKTWGQITLNVPGGARQQAAGFAIGNILYVGGGYYTNIYTSPGQTLKNDFWSMYW